MKMVKSLLLGSAAGLVAIAGAQAADLPVKAKAVEYVKVCSLYGVGYYYIPGTDTCIKIGGYVRYEAYHNAVGTNSGQFPNLSTNGVFTRDTSTFGMMARFRLTTDVRTQTEYGTLRSYFSFGLNLFGGPLDTGLTPTSNTASMERAFIQFAGFTVGRADTFFAFYNGAAYGFVPTQLDGSSGPAGKNVAAYTWQFGNGLSASLSLEDQSAYNKGVLDLNVAGSLIGATYGAGGIGDTKGAAMPDIVGNLRVDQAWGSAQVMGVLKQVGARYYNNFPGGGFCAGGGGNSTTCAAPSDEWGWAVGGGLTLNMPWDKKDTLSGVIAYGKGASGYIANAMGTSYLHKQGVAVGPNSDGVFAQPGTTGAIVGLAGYDGSIQLTTQWGGTVAFEHYWTPSLRTSWVFGYAATEYNSTAKAIIASNGCAGAAPLLTAFSISSQPCDPNWSLMRLSSRTMWNPVANLDVGLEVAYTKINTGFEGSAVVAGNPTVTGLANGRYNINDQDVWSATFRVQRSFWP